MKQYTGPFHEKLSERTVTLSLQEIITVSVFLLTFGASLYTFYNSIPELKRLNDKTHELDVTMSVTNEKLIGLKDEIERLRNDK